MKNTIINLCLVLFLFTGYKSFATHTYGGEITWTCVGKDSFLIQLTNYRDCNGIYHSTVSINFKNYSTGTVIKTINIAAPTPVDITNTCITSCNRCKFSSCGFPYGVQKYVFSAIVDLSSAGSCCEMLIGSGFESRTASSVVSYGNNVYIEAFMNRCLSPCDNSPQFKNDPVMIAYVGKDFAYNYGAIDTDTDSSGKLIDSLSYDWAVPLYAQGYPELYLSPYSFSKPIYFWGFPNDTLNPVRGFHLNHANGDISFRPMKVESTYMVVKVTEWRKINGIYQKIGEVRRDNYFGSISSVNNYLPQLTITYDNHICAGEKVEVTVKTSDADTSDVVKLKISHLISGASWSDNNGSAKNPTGTFTWQTNSNDANDLPYIFTVSANDDNCPVLGQSTKAIQFYVHPVPKAKIVMEKTSCNQFNIKATNISDVVSLKWYIDNKVVSTKNNFTFNANVSREYPIRLEIIGKGCKDVLFDTLKIPTQIRVKLPSDTIICVGDSISIQGKVIDNQGKISYLWNNIDTSSTFSISNLTSDTLLILKVSDSIYCDYDSMIVLADNFKINIVQDTVICQGLPAQLISQSIFDEGKSTISYDWRLMSCNCFMGADDTITIYDNKFFICTALNSNNCIAKDTFYADFFPLPTISLSALPNLCENGEDLVLDSFAKPVGGVWQAQDNQYISNNIFKTSIAKPKGYILYYTYTEPVHNCFITENAGIIVYPKPIVFAGNNDSICSVQGNYFLNGKPSGGKWIGEGVSDSIFNPSLVNLNKKDVFKLIYQYTDNYKCSNSDSIMLTVFEQIVADAGNDDTFCINDNLVSLFGNPSCGKWIGKGVSSNSFDPADAGFGSHKLYYSYENGLCTSIDSSWILIPQIPDTNLILVGDTLFAAKNMMTYQWFLDGNSILGKTKQYYISTQNGVYHAEIKDFFGCEFETEKFTFSDIKPKENSRITIVLNPASDLVSIYYSGSKFKINRIFITDSRGKQVRLVEKPNFPIHISVQDLSAGLYLINFMTTEGSFRSKFFID